MIDNTNIFNKNTCKDDVLQLIEEGLTANRTESFCTCRYTLSGSDMCNNCKIAQALRQARKCIVSSLVAEKEMNTKMRVTQREIEAKLKKLIGG